jgi:hypothetical protein
MTTESNSAAMSEQLNLSQDRELHDDELGAATGGVIAIIQPQPLTGLLLPAVNSARSS